MTAIPQPKSLAELHASYDELLERLDVLNYQAFSGQLDQDGLRELFKLQDESLAVFTEILRLERFAALEDRS